MVYKIDLLVVMIPAFNEEDTIAKVITKIPRRIKDVNKVLVLVGDDGSKDATIDVALKAGADVVLRQKRNVGLARNFAKMCEKCLELHADVVINIDADGQYVPKEIRLLLKPILLHQADMVIGDRRVRGLTHMPNSKKFGNMTGSAIVRWLSGTDVQDASSGFRAYTKECLQSFDLISGHTYTHETIIQAAFMDMVIVNVPVSFLARRNGTSRLISGIWPHIQKSAATIVRAVLMYKAFRYLLLMGGVISFLGVLLGVRFVLYYLNGEGDGHIQSLILAAVLINVGFLTCLLGVVADLVGINRKLLHSYNRT